MHAPATTPPRSTAPASGDASAGAVFWATSVNPIPVAAASQAALMPVGKATSSDSAADPPLIKVPALIILAKPPANKKKLGTKTANFSPVVPEAFPPSSGAWANTSCQAHSKAHVANQSGATLAPSIGALPAAMSTVPQPCRRKMGPHMAKVSPAGVTFVG